MGTCAWPCQCGPRGSRVERPAVPAGERSLTMTTREAAPLADAVDPPHNAPPRVRGSCLQEEMPITRGQSAHEIVPFPALQQLALEWLELERRRHTMYGLIEVDVTAARHAIREYRARTGMPLS